MLCLVTRTEVAGLSGLEITDFLSTCNDQAYQRWWPGTHLQLHTVAGEAGQIGSLVYMDEFIGARRIDATFELVELVPGRRLVLKLARPVRLPVAFELDLEDGTAGVHITHRIRAGYRGGWRFLDRLFRLWFSRRFVADMDEHVRTEFHLLKDLLHPGEAGGGAQK